MSTTTAESVESAIDVTPVVVTPAEAASRKTPMDTVGWVCLVVGLLISISMLGWVAYDGSVSQGRPAPIEQPAQR